MCPLAIVMISLLLLECVYHVEPGQTWQPHSRRPRCERKFCDRPSDCKSPCTRCAKGLWEDGLCKIK
uniref:Putative 5.3 kDa protein n=1 Tax=Ixodes ricinus TaxID=34613 RepID=A0A0K8R740_IXORI